MKKWSFRAIVLAIACVFNLNLVRADILDGEQAVAAPAAADCCCDCGGCASLVVDVEWTFLRLHRSDGFGLDNITGFESAPRISVGYVNADGLGARIRYWSWDHTAVDAGNVARNVDTYNIDLELYRSIDLTCNTTIEIAGGVRYNDYQDLGINAGNGVTSSFSGYGGIFEVRASHALCLFGINGRVYGRAAWAILMDNETLGAVTVFDTVNTQEEIGFGYEVAHCLCNGSVLTLRAGAEFQSWDGYDDVNDGPIGFGGFVVGAGLTF